jgi:hypothetical protein
MWGLKKGHHPPAEARAATAGCAAVYRLDAAAAVSAVAGDVRIPMKPDAFSTMKPDSVPM